MEQGGATLGVLFACQPDGFSPMVMVFRIWLKIPLSAIIVRAPRSVRRGDGLQLR